MGRRTWTDKQLDDLARLWNGPDQLSVIAQRFGKTTSSIAGQARRQGLPPRRAQVAHRVNSKTRFSASVPGFDPKRADKLLRKFSWEAP